MSTAAEQRNQEMAKSAWGMLDKMKPSIAAVLPKHLTPERMAMIAFTAMRRNPKLLECSHQSIIGSILTAAMLGLEPSGPLGHGALIPYKGECQFQPMYQGLLDLARRSGFIKDVQLRAVYRGDHYLYRFGLDPTIEHIPMEGEGADSPDREATHVYCIIRLVNGGVQWDQMSYAQGLAHGKRYSQSWNTREAPNAFKPGSVWADNPLAMILKTIIKKVLKLCPKSPELASALLMDDLHDDGKTTVMTKVADNVFDVDITEERNGRGDGHERGTFDTANLKPGAEDNRGHGHENLATVTQPAASPGPGQAPASGSPAGDPADPGDQTADFTTILRAAKDNKLKDKQVYDYIKDRLGYPIVTKLKVKDVPQLMAWIANGGKDGDHGHQ